MRALPVLGSFDLVTCIDDALNHLLTEADVLAALASMARNLAPDGLLVFDVNTLATYRTTFACSEVFDVGDHRFTWRGLAGSDFAAGGIAQLEVDVAAPGRRATTVHHERHYPVATIESLAHEAGLEVVERRGQSTGVVLQPHIDERRHAKALFLMRRRRDR
jgi:SAM-dependent methyltransferase